MQSIHGLWDFFRDGMGGTFHVSQPEEMRWAFFFLGIGVGVGETPSAKGGVFLLSIPVFRITETICFFVRDYFVVQYHFGVRDEDRNSSVR